MQLFLRGTTFPYETENVIRLFLPFEKIETISSGSPSAGKFIVTEVFTYDDSTVEIGVQCYLLGYEKQERITRTDIRADSHETEMTVAKMLYRCLAELTGIKPPWGVLTGVRPSKLMRQTLQKYDSTEAVARFKKEYLVSEKKAKLALEVANSEDKIISAQGKNPCSVYVAIPFCPTRCSYCSFVSHSIDSAKKLIPDYTDRLVSEISRTSEIIKELNLDVKTIYIGGGTPTSIDDKYFEKIIKTLSECFDLNSIKEFTVEAGRPDTITESKLKIMKENGVGRISINPQTFHDDVLKNIGRSHSVAEIFDVFELARKAGFDNINMDLIAGLPGDSVDGFVESVNKAISLDPENITVHTLAMKRASTITTEHEQNTACLDTMEMLDRGNSLLYDAGYSPYYMYRQSKSVGNLENVGWTKPGFDCLYNVFMMEETQSVFACGAGAVTKLVGKDENGENVIDRVFNFKYPYEYIDRYSIVEDRKKKIFDFYENQKGGA